MNNPEKQAPGKAEWGDNFDCGPCRQPEPDYSFQHIDSEQSGFSGHLGEMERPPQEEYPHDEITGYPIRGKYFTDPLEHPQSAAGYRPLPLRYDKILRGIEEWEVEHNPKPEPFKLDELTSSDYYNKVYVNDGGAVRYNDIKIGQIKLYPLTAELWLKYRRIEGAYHEIRYEALKAGAQATVYRPQSRFPFFHDSLIQLRNQITKRTGFSYRTVDRGLNHMLKKSIISDLRGYRAYSLDLECIWNRTNLWQEDCERIINARKADGADWIKKDVSEWQEYGDFTWQHRKAYCKEHQTLI